MNKADLKKYKTKLEEELGSLKSELEKTGRKNPDYQNGWDAKPDEIDVLPSDDSEVADKLESYEENQSIMTEFEKRYEQVKNALVRIENDTYGTCKVCKKIIEPERLNANAGAETCIEHKDQ